MIQGELDFSETQHGRESPRCCALARERQFNLDAGTSLERSCRIRRSELPRVIAGARQPRNSRAPTRHSRQEPQAVERLVPPERADRDTCLPPVLAEETP